jgi:hypothetical protein
MGLMGHMGLMGYIGRMSFICPIAVRGREVEYPVRQRVEDDYDSPSSILLAPRF